ncbi:hypothetical protein T261_3958 [Streptomyces lydicus]|nr:hypothetical protein T261_3958 [Streptomyces lydicus]
MIEASIGALPGLIPSFLVIAVILGVPSAIVAKAKGNSLSLSLLFAAALAGVLTVTLMPGDGGSGRVGICEAGLPLQALLSSESAQLNVLLFIPVSCLAVLLFRRPVLTLSGTLALTSGVELIQSWTDLGRACSYDDIKANALGGLLGVLIGTVILWVQKHRPPFTRKDAVWGVCAGGLGALILTASFALAVEPVHREAQSEDIRAQLGDQLKQDAWLQKTVAALYGKDAQITQSASEKLANGHRRLKAETERGEVFALWPERKLERLVPNSAESGTGSLSEAEMRAAGEKFAKKWFPDEVAGAKITGRALQGKHSPYLLSYRRYVDGVMMPMRLNLSVSPAGRVMSVAARSTKDPTLPKAVVTKAVAKKQAESGAGNFTATPVKLLAQRVDHTWRPVWMVSLARGPKQEVESTAFIDAVTGHEVTPEPIEAGDSHS